MTDDWVARGKALAESGKYRAAADTVESNGQVYQTGGPDGLGSAEPNPSGAELLDDLHDTFVRYVALPDRHSSVAVTLWTAATHALPAFEFAPRLVATSPEKRCGKTRLLDIITGTCHKPLATVNATVAAIFRSINGDHPPTLVIDEADTIFGSKKAAENHEDLRALLNAGHQRGRPALRCVGPMQIPTEFNTFAMSALAGIGNMPDTITDRAINVSMRRRASGEKVAQFRSRRDGPKLVALRDRLATWAAAHIEELKQAQPEMPVEDRAADTWEPLVAVADLAGGDWPQRARAACKALVDRAADADEDGSLSTRLLADIRTIFAERAVPFIASADLLSSLSRLDESPWSEFEMTTRKLAWRLKPFGVRSERNTTGSVRGYRLDALKDAFARYLADHPSEASEASETQREQQQPIDTSKPSDGSIRQNEIIRQNETAAHRPFLTLLTDSDISPPDNDSTAPGFTPPTGPDRCDNCGCHIPTQGHKPDCPANTPETQ
jgi:hypothetical protein